MLVESVMDRIKDGISLDHMARLIVDVHQDSSRVTDSFLSAYQLALLDLIFTGDRVNRDKINVLVADEIVPKLPAEKYMDRGPCENELKQCLGETRFAYDISEEDVIIFGNHGILLGGRSARKHERTLYVYLGLIGKDIFIQNYFNRSFILLDTMSEVRKQMSTKTADPNTIDIVRARLAEASKDIISLDEVLNYLKEALDCMTLPTMPSDPPGRKLYEVLDIATTRMELMRRVTDMAKIISSAKQELAILTQMSESLVADRAYFQQNQLTQNTAEIRNIVTSNTNIRHTLNMVQTILCGMFAFALLDRLTGTWTVTNRVWAQGLVETLLSTQYLFLIFNLLVWAGVAHGAARVIRGKTQDTEMFSTVKIQLDEEINDTERFTVWLAGKSIIFEDATWDLDRNNTKVTWQEEVPVEWGGHAPRIECEYDADNSYILSVSIMYSRAEGKLTTQELRAKIMDELRDWDIVTEVAFLDEQLSDDEED